MKILLIIFCMVLFLSCKRQQPNSENLQLQIDSLRSQIAKTYKPGLGEFMSSIQVHHEKLWFAGENKNWKLADFEIDEIKEALQNIKDYCSNRPEVKSITMIEAPIDSITASIQQQNSTSFKSAFIFLTNTCNNCHKETNHEFNVMKLPETPPFSNQKFQVP